MIRKTNIPEKGDLEHLHDEQDFALQPLPLHPGPSHRGDMSKGSFTQSLWGHWQAGHKQTLLKNMEDLVFAL